MAVHEVLRAYRFALDPTSTQLESLRRHAGAQRWAYNYALARKVAAHQEWRAQVDALVATGLTESVARKSVKVPIPNVVGTAAHWRTERGDAATGTEGVSPWWREVSSYTFSSGFRNADAAWKNWLDSVSGRRAGRAVGYPRFKSKGRARDTFALYHDAKRPTIRPDGYRHLQIPRVGSVRLHDSAKRLSRLIERGSARVQSVTVSRGGNRWYASVLCIVQQDVPETPTRRQCRAGTVGVDLGVKDLAILSTGEHIPNPRHLDADAKRLVKAQRALSRAEKGSARRKKAAAKVGRIHHRVAQRRNGRLHQVSKRLAAGWAWVALEDLNVAGMTRSAKGTTQAPGKRVQQKSGLNRAVLDASLAELRRQITYKSVWYGSRVAVCDRWAPTSKACSGCGAVKPKLSLSERVYRCDGCGLVMDRDENAARNIARMAVACDTRETLNARGVEVRPAGRKAGGRAALKREDPAQTGPPRGSDPPTFQPHV